MASPIYFSLVFFSATALTIAQPTVGGVSNGASFQPNISPGCLISIFGSNLATATKQASTVPLPIALSGTSVTIGGIQAPLYFVSNGQINAQVPFELQQPYGNGEKTLVVTTSAGASSAFPLNLQPESPAIFTRTSNGQGSPLLFDANFHSVGTPSAGETLILYATGLGQTDPAVATGAGGNSAEPFSRLQDPPTVFVGERPASVSFAGMAPGFVGVYQLNIVMPSQALLSDRLYLGVPGMGQRLVYASNVTSFAVPASLNVANVSGSISAVYPDPTSLITSSPALVVATLSAKFDILAGAQPFSLFATADGLAPDENVEIDFTPATGAFAGAASTPSPAARQWNFGNDGFLVLDLLDSGAPFPGNVIPLSRVDPAAVAAVADLPIGTPVGAGSATDAVGLQGTAPAGSTFLVNDSTNTALSVFAGYLDVYVSPSVNINSTTLRLYVDGNLVSSSAVPFQTP